jgi:hypothetical protein
MDDPPEPTGEPAADEALEQLRRLDDAPVAEHAEIYDAVHRKLTEAMSNDGDD